MIVSYITFQVICTIIGACILVPLLYLRFVKKNSNSRLLGLLFLIFIPVGLYTPAIYDVSNCGEYTKKVLILPKGEYSLGMHNYIVNNSDQELFFEYLVYGNSKLSDDQMDMIIAPGTTFKAPTTEINYVFTDAPSSIKIKGDGEIRERLSCDVPDYELNEDDIQSLIEEMGVEDEAELKEVLREELDLSDSLDLSQFSLQELLEMSSEVN